MLYIHTHLPPSTEEQPTNNIGLHFPLTTINLSREHLLRRLEDQLAAIMPGAGERPKEK